MYVILYKYIITTTVMSYNYIFKLIIIGNSSVGKSSMLNRYVSDKFAMDYDITIGVGYGSKLVNKGGIKNNGLYDRVKMQIWDTAGQELFKSITRSYYNSSLAVLLCYDITNHSTFLSTKEWLEEILRYCQHRPYIILVGTKSDIEHRRQVPTEIARKFASENNMMFIEVTSKNTKDVLYKHLMSSCDAFNMMCDKIYNDVIKNKENIFDHPLLKMTVSLENKRIAINNDVAPQRICDC